MYEQYCSLQKINKNKMKPIINRNEPLTKCKLKREKKGEKIKKNNKKKTHVADSVTVSMSGVFSPFFCFCISNSFTQRSYRPSYHSFNGSHDNQTMCSLTKPATVLRRCSRKLQASLYWSWLTGGHQLSGPITPLSFSVTAFRPRFIHQ